MEVEHKILPQEESSLSFFVFARKIIDRTHLVVVRTVGAFLYAGVFFLVAYLDADDRVHVQSGQLPRFDDRHTHLEVLRLEVIVALGQILDPDGYQKRVNQNVTDLKYSVRQEKMQKCLTTDKQT